MRHRERRKRVKTMREPTRIPMTTQRRRPKIDVFLDSCVSMNAASYTDMMMMMFFLVVVNVVVCVCFSMRFRKLVALDLVWKENVSEWKMEFLFE